MSRPEMNFVSVSSIATIDEFYSMPLKTSKNRIRRKRVGIIVGPNKEQVMETVRSVDWNADIEFIYQGEPK